MGIFRALVLYHFFHIFVTLLSFSCQASNEDRKDYIVYMGALPQGINYSPNTHHLSILENVLEGSSSSNSLIRSYRRSFNGFAAKLTEQERDKLASLKEVVSVFPNELYHTQTTKTWDFMGLHLTAKRNPTVESNTIVGVIDTGIWPESESFSDEGFGPPPKKWKGACQGGKNFTCNNKLIGARFYSSKESDITSARDSIGHGTHTASTAAGNNVHNASFYEVAKGTARGGVPSSRVAAYKVCSENGCSGIAILAAFDDAIADGVDVITISIGNQSPNLFLYDVIAIGSFHSMDKGILTVQSAGNNGPDSGLIPSLAPWLVSAAASTTDKRIVADVVLADQSTLIGHSVNGFELNTTYPLILGENASTTCSEPSSRACQRNCLDSGLVKGKILICDGSYSDAQLEVHRAGGIGVVFPFPDNFDIAFVNPLPTSLLSSHDFDRFLSYHNSTKDPRAFILKSEIYKDANTLVPTFSARGPNSISPDILKPDITAPGVEILAAYSLDAPPSSDVTDKRRVKYNVITGTSMSCPHVAGVAAYVKTFHPDWSPSAIKSSIMTTAFKLRHDDGDGEFGYGSGHVNPVKALNLGLIYETFTAEYIQYLCSLGPYRADEISRITGHNTTCPKGSDQWSSRNLNYPSLTARVPQGKAFTAEFQRRVKNVGSPNSTYKATVVPKLDFKVLVKPDVLSFESLNEEKHFNVSINGSAFKVGTKVSMELVWSDGVHSVRSPIVVHNIHTD